MTADTPSDEILVLPNIKRVKSNITTNIPFRMKGADYQIAICTGIPFSSFKSGRRAGIGEKLRLERKDLTFGSDCPQSAANHNLAIGSRRLFE